MTQSQRDLNAFMAIAVEGAIADAKLMPTTPDIKRRAHALAEFARVGIAAQRRADLAKRPSNVVTGAIRAVIAALSPTQAIEQLRSRFIAHPELQSAYRDYQDMSDEDVRSALEDIESLLESGN